MSYEENKLKIKTGSKIHQSFSYYKPDFWEQDVSTALRSPPVDMEDLFSLHKLNAHRKMEKQLLLFL